MQHKVVLVTGASSGAGRAIALHLTSLGCRVYGTTRRPAAPAPFRMLKLDVRDEASVTAAVEEALGREGRIDVLVNNAGIALVAGLEETTPDQLRDMLEVNAVGAFTVMRAVLPGMRSRDRGHIVNVSSLSGLIGYPYLGAYAASKHALEALSEALRFELFDTKIRVSLVEPDGMRTGIAFLGPESDHPIVGPRRRALLARLEHAVGDGGTDPMVLARKVADLISRDRPPLRSVVGDAAERLIGAKSSMTPEAFEAMIVGDVHASAG